MLRQSEDAWREQYERIYGDLLKYCETIPAFTDEEDIHQARVNGRKLLTLFGALDVNTDHPLVSRVKEIMKLLGRVRDLDVTIQDIQRELSKNEGSGIHQAYLAFNTLLEEERDCQRKLVRDQLPGLVDAGFHDIFLQFLNAEMGEIVEQINILDFVSGLERRCNRRLDAFIRLKKKFGEADSKTLEALHRLRISVKRLRYTLDDLNFAHHINDEGQKKLLKKLQNELGEINDLHNRKRRWTGSKGSFTDKGLRKSYKKIKRRMKREIAQRIKKAAKLPRFSIVHKLRETPMTYDDYANMPDDGIRYELAGGRLEAMTPAPHPRHQLVLQQLEDVIKGTCHSEYIVFLSPVDVILSETEVRQPDLLMLHRSRLSLVTRRGIEGPPDLVAEVLSPFSVKRDREDKRHTYARYGVREYWIVDINNRVLEQYVLDGNAYVLEEVFTEETPIRSERLPCVTFSMKEIIESLPELPD